MTRTRGESPVAGQLLLFRSSGIWYEQCIKWATHGWAVHVEVVLSSTEMIGAHHQGVVISPLPPPDEEGDAQGEGVAGYSVIEVAPYTEAEHITPALAWAAAQVGTPYGWVDILYQGLKFLWPNNPFRFGVAGHYDCSDFATRFLQHAGVVLPDAFSDPYANSPSDLGRLFGLIPPRSPKYAAVLPLAPPPPAHRKDTVPLGNL